MPKDVTVEYQVSLKPYLSLDLPKARLENTSPVSGEHKPIALVDDAAAPGTGAQIVGTLINFESTNDIVTANVAPGAIHYHQVRNVLTYAAAAEDTFAKLDVGTKLYYDRSSTMPSKVFLSLSPLDKDDVVNPFFGWVVLGTEEVPDPWATGVNPYPVGSTSAGTTHTDIAVMQVGCGGGHR